MKKLVVIISLLIILIFLFYFFFKDKTKKTKGENGSGKKITVSASFYPLYFFASEIGRDKAEVNNITPFGAEPHDYEPAPKDIARIENSQLLILNGANLEPWGNKIKDILKHSGITIVVAGDKIATQNLNESGKTILDPHIWLAPTLAKIEVETILYGYLKVDPKDANYYAQNADNLLHKLDELDTDFRSGLSSCKKRDFVTSHAAFGYLAKEYHLNQVAISGISPDEEPSAKTFAQIADFAKKNDIHYIFFESLVSPKMSETIASEIGAKTLVLDPVEGISDQKMQKGTDYFSIMQNNLKNLRLALECS